MSVNRQGNEVVSVRGRAMYLLANARSVRLQKDGCVVEQVRSVPWCRKFVGMDVMDDLYPTSEHLSKNRKCT